MPSSREYWRERELEHIRKQMKDDKKLQRRIRDMYMQALDDIQAQIEAFYGRYASREGISMSEAIKRARKLDIEKYARKAERYVRQAHSGIPFIRWQAFTDKANTEM